jgi:ATP-dependent Clp protease ATP-binding subunit ClpA
MFERFTQSARRAVAVAQDEARSLDHGWIGTEHLLLGLLADPGTPVSTAVAGLGVTHDRVRAELVRTLGTGPAAPLAEPAREQDDEALREIGIDIDAVRRRVEEQFGPGALEECTPAPSQRPWWRLGRRRDEPGPRPAAPKGHIPFTRRAKKALELSLRESISTASGEIAAEHVMLGLLRAEGLAATLLEGLGARPAEVRARMLDQLGRAA